MLKSALLLLTLSISYFVYAQEAIDNDLKIFLDCNVCDNTYMRQNLGNVQFVRNQDLSDVHLFFVTQRNGSGGRLFDIDFIGKNEFKDINYELSFSTDSNMTRDDERQLTLENIKLGLLRFWIAKGTLTNVSVSVPNPENETEKEDEIDPWDYWVFRVGANGFFDGQETNSSSNLNINVSVEELLLQQQQLQSGYNYFVSLGFSYQFGSIYNSIVNLRFSF